MQIGKNGKTQIMERIALPNEKRIRTLRQKKTFKYIGILEADIVKQVVVKEK